MSNPPRSLLSAYSSEPETPPQHMLSQRLLPDPDDARIWTRAQCEALFKRVVAMTKGGGDTQVSFRSTWTGNLRWGRNRPTTSGDTTESWATITRMRNGVRLDTTCDQFDDTALQKTVGDLEQALSSTQPNPQAPELDLLPKQTYLPSVTWDEATANSSMQQLSDSARRSVDPAVDAKLIAAGYIAVGAATWAIYNTRGLDAYATASGVMYAETVRNIDGTASGWAGKCHMDWKKLDTLELSKRALSTCQKSANPVAVEPGRYTAILHPIVTAILMHTAVDAMDRRDAEESKTAYTLSKGVSKIGHQILDSRVTITSDPQDPDCGFMPFDPEGNPYGKVTWVENGILKNLAYDRAYARSKLHSDVALPNPMAFRMSGGDTSIDQMIAATERGILVMHTSTASSDDVETLMVSSLTRDGLFLIEKGKITHPIKNMWFTESPMTIFNKITHLGPPERTVGIMKLGWAGGLRDLPSRAVNDGRIPLVAPPVRVEDFRFTRLTDAV